MDDLTSHRRRRTSLEKEIAEQLAAISAAQARLCELVEEHDRKRLWADSVGITSESMWLAWRGGMVPGQARSLVALANKLKELPALRQAFSSGRLSLSQAQAVASIATPETDGSLTELALGLSGSQLATFAKHYRAAIDAGQDAHPKRYFSVRYTEHGECRFSGRASAEIGATVEKALRVAASEQPLDEEAEDRFGARDLDALLAIAESSLAHELASRSRPDAFQVVVHVDRSVLEGGQGDCYIPGAGAITPDVAERLLCDASVVEIEMAGSEVLDVGRASRRYTTAIRRALEARDKQCRFPGCGNTSRLQNHHMKEWVADQGGTSLEEGVRLCALHHATVHRHRIKVVRNAARGWDFIAADGTLLARPPPERVSSSVNELNSDRGVAVDDATCLPGWGGERGDMRYVTDVYLNQHRN